MTYAGCPDPEGKALTCFWDLVCCALQQAFFSDPLALGLFGILEYSQESTKLCSQLCSMNVVMSLASHCMTSDLYSPDHVVRPIWPHMGTRQRCRSSCVSRAGVGVGLASASASNQGWESGTFCCCLGNKLGEIVNREWSGEGVRGRVQGERLSVCLWFMRSSQGKLGCLTALGVLPCIQGVPGTFATEEDGRCLHT